MPRIHGLDDILRVFRDEKTVIRKGYVVREKVWRNGLGQEFSPPSRLLGGPETTLYDEEEQAVLLALFCAAAALFMFGFALGVSFRAHGGARAVHLSRTPASSGITLRGAEAA